MKWFNVSYRNYHLIFFRVKSENFSRSSFSSNQKISHDLFFPANIRRSFQQIKKANDLLFQQIKKIQWPSLPTNQKISDDLLSQQIRTVFLPCPLPLSRCLQSCWYLVKINLCYPFLQLSTNFQQILPKCVIFCQRTHLLITGQMCPFVQMCHFSICKKSQMCSIWKKCVNLNLWRKKHTCW